MNCLRENRKALYIEEICTGLFDLGEKGYQLPLVVTCLEQVSELFSAIRHRVKELAATSSNELLCVTGTGL